MGCEKCKETDCLVSSNFTLEDGTRVFADLRFDLENNKLDMQYGTLEEEGYRTKEVDWSYSAKVRFCPFCGRELPKVQEKESIDNLKKIKYNIYMIYVILRY